MRIHKMTKWDEGQVLIKASDMLFGCSNELRETQPELSWQLFHMGCEIGEVFNKFGSHQFGLRDLIACHCPRCETAAERESQQASGSKE